jgi:hypothetical protein
MSIVGILQILGIIAFIWALAKGQKEIAMVIMGIGVISAVVSCAVFGL